MFAEGTDFGLIDKIATGGPSLILAVVLFFLARAYKAERDRNNALTDQLLEHVTELSNIPEALERLRNDVMGELRSKQR